MTTYTPDGRRNNVRPDNSPALGGGSHGGSGMEPRLGGKAAVGELLEALRGRDLQARLAAGRILKRVRDPQAVKLLLAALDDEHAQVRSVAAAALGVIVSGLDEPARSEINQEVAAALTRALRDRSIPVRMAAARALGQTGDREALPALIDALKDISPHVRGASAWAIGEVGARHPEEGARALPTVIAMLHDVDGSVRAQTAEALGRIGAACSAPRTRTYAVPTLLDAFRDPSVQVRSAAARALGRIGPDAAPGLVAALRDDEMQVRSAAAWVLQEIGDKYGQAAAKAAPALIAALDDVDERVRWYAVGALGVIRDPRAVPGLVKMLEDTDQPPGLYDEKRICDVAAEALERIGTAEARAALRIWRVAQSMD